MSSLREKINNLDTQNLQNNDTLYSILEEMADRIEKLEEKEQSPMRKYDGEYYIGKIYFSEGGIASFTANELRKFFTKIIEDKEFP